MSQPTIDVIAIGNAIVDVMAPCADDLIDQLGLVRGGMTLIDTARAKELYAAMGPAREISGAPWKSPNGGPISQTASGHQIAMKRSRSRLSKPWQ